MNIISLALESLYVLNFSRITWRNGSAVDFGSIGWGFESLCGRFFLNKLISFIVSLFILKLFLSFTK